MNTATVTTTAATVSPFIQNLQQQQPQKPQTSKEAIAANVKALIEQLEEGHSEGLTAYLTAMGRFHNYSFGNILEIARQKPSATRVAGMYAWNQLGRRVNKGEKGIRILAPMTGVRRKKDTEAAKDVRTQNQSVLVGFRSVYVFDVSQTEGLELPELSSRVSGEVGERMERLLDFVSGQGILLEFKESIAPALGMSYGGKIVLLPGQTPAEEFSTLVHEVAHEMLHKAERRTATTKVVRETEAEAIAFVVGQTIGLTTGRASADYIHLYYGNAALLTESLEVIQKTSAAILSALEAPAAEPTELAEASYPFSTGGRPHAVRSSATRSPNRSRSATMNPTTATEYRNLPLAVLTESTTNPRHIFEDAALKELAESIRTQGILSPLLVRPTTGQGFEIVAGARRYRAAQMAEATTVPVRIVNLTDAEAMEAALVENLIRADVYPLEEAQGFHALLMLEEPKYSIEQIGAKVGKPPAYIAARTRLTELTALAVTAFYAEEIGVGHALLLAKLQPAQQEQALTNCFREEWSGGAGRKAKRILLPIKHLHQWIEQNVLLFLKQAPFNKRDAQLVPAAGSCVECPKRTGNNKLLFAELSESEAQCTDPTCYAVKLEAHVQKQLSTKPELVQISTAYGGQAEGSKIVTRNKYVEIRQDKADSPDEAKRPEFKTCKFTKEAIIAEGLEKGEVRQVCTQSDCPIHHPNKQPTKADASFKAEQDKRRREEALANATGTRVLQTIAAAVPVRLMKRDLLFIAEQMLPLLDEKRVEMIARNRGIRAKEGETAIKLLTSFLRKAEESAIGRLIVETVILLSARSQNDGGRVLRAAAQAYKVDTDAIALKVKQEFSAKEKARKAPQPIPKILSKAKKAA